MTRNRKVRLPVIALGCIACLWGVWTSAREGSSQFLAGRSAMTEELETAAQAVRLDPSNPEAHYVRAKLLATAENQSEAIREYEHAVALRPRDYALWLALGRDRDLVGDMEGAIAAFDTSAQLAPFYARPHWQLGNTLYRAGRTNEAMKELRLAGASNPNLLPQVINLAWALSGDPELMYQALQPQTASAHFALATFFARHARASDSIAQFRAAGELSNEQRRVLVTDLLASKSFAEMFEVWLSGHPSTGGVSPNGIATIRNGGFEEPITLNDPGFGWQVATNLQGVHLSLDSADPHAGSYGLRVDWSGDSDPSRAAVSQLVLVEQHARYRLTFAVRTQEMLTVGLPVLTVTDVSGEGEPVLAQSKTFPRGTTEWQSYAIEFTTTEMTRAVMIAIRRENCAMTPCAAIGHAWTDDFQLERM